MRVISMPAMSLFDHFEPVLVVAGIGLFQDIELEVIAAFFSQQEIYSVAPVRAWYDLVLWNIYEREHRRRMFGHPVRHLDPISHAPHIVGRDPDGAVLLPTEELNGVGRTDGKRNDDPVVNEVYVRALFLEIACRDMRMSGQPEVA